MSAAGGARGPATDHPGLPVVRPGLTVFTPSSRPGTCEVCGATLPKNGGIRRYCRAHRRQRHNRTRG